MEEMAKRAEMGRKIKLAKNGIFDLNEDLVLDKSEEVDEVSEDKSEEVSEDTKDKKKKRKKKRSL
jgi:hypothetical protein